MTSQFPPRLGPKRNRPRALPLSYNYQLTLSKFSSFITSVLVFPYFIISITNICLPFFSRDSGKPDICLRFCGQKNKQLQSPESHLHLWFYLVNLGWLVTVHMTYNQFWSDVLWLLECSFPSPTTLSLHIYHHFHTPTTALLWTPIFFSSTTQCYFTSHSYLALANCNRGTL